MGQDSYSDLFFILNIHSASQDWIPYLLSLTFNWKRKPPEDSILLLSTEVLKTHHISHNIIISTK